MGTFLGPEGCTQVRQPFPEVHTSQVGEEPRIPGVTNRFDRNPWETVIIDNLMKQGEKILPQE